MIPSIFDSDPRASRLINFAADLVGELRPDLKIDDDELREDIMRRWRIESSGTTLLGEPLQGVIRDMIQHAWCYGDAVIVHGKTEGYAPVYLDCVSSMLQIDTLGRLVATQYFTSAVEPAQYSLLRFRRKDKWRGKPTVGCTYAHLRDISQIVDNYKEAIKTSSTAGLVLETQAPMSTPVEDLNIFPGTGNTVQNRDSAQAGGAIVLRDGEQLKILSDDRPRPEVIDFLDLLKSEIAFGFGLPAELVYDCFKLKGSQTRLRTSEAINWVAHHRARVADLLTQIWGRWVIDRYIKPLGITDAKLISQLVRPAWQAKSPIIVDQRYDSQTTISMIDNGLMSRSEVVAANGGDWQETITQLAREKARMIELGLNDQPEVT